MVESRLQWPTSRAITMGDELDVVILRTLLLTQSTTRIFKMLEGDSGEAYEQ